MFIYKNQENGKYYKDYNKAVNALKCLIGSRYPGKRIIYNNLPNYYNQAGERQDKSNEYLPRIVLEMDNEEFLTLEIAQIKVVD